MSLKLIVFFCVLKYGHCQYNDDGNLTLFFKWNSLDFEWLNNEQKSQYLAERKFIPENSVIREFKIYENLVYVALPRWKTGIPATLATFAVNSSVLLPDSPSLQPYPSWPMQALNNCSSLQSVHAIDIDKHGKLWALDNGMVEELEANTTLCPSKLVIIDLQSKSVVKQVDIPPDVKRIGSVFTSMALDRDRQILYIADSNYFSSGFVVYNYSSGIFKRFVCEELSPDDDSSTVNYIPNNITPEFVSLALNTDKNKLYFSTFGVSDLFYVNVSLFSRNIADVSSFTVNMGKNGKSVKLMSDSMGYMYFDILNRKSVAQWRESSWVFQYTPRIVLESKLLCHWISSLEVDKNGYLWIVSSRFHDYVYNKTNMEKENIRIFRVFVPRKERPKRPKTGFNVEYIVLVLFVIIIGLIVFEILMFNRD